MKNSTIIVATGCIVVLLLSIWFVSSFPSETPEQIREKIYRECVRAYTINSGGGHSINECEQIKR